MVLVLLRVPSEGLEPEHSGESPTSDPSPRLDAAPPLLARATSGEGARPVATEETEAMEGGAKEDTVEEWARGSLAQEAHVFEGVLPVFQVFQASRRNEGVGPQGPRGVRETV